LLAAEAPLSGEAQDFSRFERLVPLGFERHFYYRLGRMAMSRHPNQVPEAVAAVEFLRHRSAAAHHLALVGIYRFWPEVAALDSSREAVANSPAPMAPELSQHYWRALGYLAGHSWYDTDHSLSLLNARVQAFVPPLDPKVQKYFLQGVGQALLTFVVTSDWVRPAELERFPQAYQEGLLEGWGMALSEDELFSRSPWKGQESPLWMAATKGFSSRSLASVQRGKAQFEALFEGASPSALDLPRPAP